MQVEHRPEVVSEVEGHGSEETVSGGASIAASINIRMLWFLQKSPRQRLMQLSSRRVPTTNFRMVQKSKSRSSVVEVVIPKASKGAQ